MRENVKWKPFGNPHEVSTEQFETEKERERCERIGKREAQSKEIGKHKAELAVPHLPASNVLKGILAYQNGSQQQIAEDQQIQLDGI